MSATCSIASAYSRFQAPALKNNGVSDNILTTTSERGNSWTTLLEEGRFSIASRAFRYDQRGSFSIFFRKLLLSGGSPCVFPLNFFAMSSPERGYRVLDAGTTDSGAVVIRNVDLV